MSKKLIALAAGILILSVVLAVILRKPREVKPQKTWVEETKRRSGPCPAPEEGVEVEGKKYKFLPNWYECNPMKTGETVYYRFSFSKSPVARRLVAVPGNRFSVRKNKEHENWELLVNDKLALSSERKPITFGSLLHDPTLSLYEKGGVGTLKRREAIVFSDPVAGQLDSSLFGVVNADDFLGKLELVQPKE